MSGAKRRTPYRKQVTDSVLYELVVPTDSQRVAVVLRSHGSNILEVQCEGGDIGLAMLPTKFRKLVWVKRGDAVLLSGAEGSFTTSAGTEGRVRYIIDTVLYPDQLKNLRTTGRWPAELDCVLGAKAAGTGSAADDSAAGGAGASGSGSAAPGGAGGKKGSKASGGAKSVGHGKLGKSDPAKMRGLAGAGGGAALAAAMLAKASYAPDDDEDGDDEDADGAAGAGSGDDADRDVAHAAAEDDDEADDDNEDESPPTWSRGQGRRDLPPSDEEDDYEDDDDDNGDASAGAGSATDAGAVAAEAAGRAQAAAAAAAAPDAAVDTLADGVAAASLSPREASAP